jgi:5-carboxymethyl-2-hydroxymuconate isomerase
MPHLIVEYTDNLAPAFDAGAILRAANRSLIDGGEFEPDNIKSRAVPLVDYRVGDHDADQAFVHAHLHILPGRSESQRRALSERLRDVLREHCPKQSGLTTQITVEVLELHRDFYAKAVV